MTRYIDADAFAEKLKSLHGHGDFEANFYCAETCYGLGNWVWECPEDYGIEAAENELKSFPTADVAPVVHGKWKETEPLMCGTYGNALWLFECSNCGRTYFTTHKYCPSCGAKMDLEE